jgi:methyl-accepting chemotaxis protein
MNIQWSVGKRLAGGFGIALLMLLTIGGVSYWSLNVLIDSAWWVTHTYQVMENLEGILSLLKDAETGQRGFLLTRQERYLEPYKEAQSKIPKRIKDLRELTADNKGLQKERINDLEDLIAKRNEELQKTIELRRQDDAKETADLKNAKHLEEALKIVLTDTGKLHMDKIRAKVAEMKDVEQNLLNDRLKDQGVSILTAKLTIILGSSAAIVILSWLSYKLTRGITGPLEKVVERAQKIAAGNLKQEKLPVSSSDELGQLTTAFNTMLESLQVLTGQAANVAGSLITASSQIATAAQQQVTSLNETGTALNQVTTSSEEFKATMQEFADRARAVQEAADETTQRTHKGRDLSQDSADRIVRVRKNAQEAGESVLRLTEQMQRIGEITASVNEIAEQTKLLALNASIEAARAGEEGRGFAVVATQVRELANQSKEAAGRIEHLIGETQKSMQGVATKIEEGSRLSSDSSEIVRQVANNFEEIARAIEQTTDAMKQINVGARQQEQGISQLVASITEIDSSSKESLASAQQTQRSILAINQEIQRLNEALAKFTM